MVANLVGYYPGTFEHDLRSTVSLNKASVLARASARGLTAAMAMSGARRLTTNLGLMEQTPPEAMVERGAPQSVKDLDPEKRAAVTELAHWAYGAGGGLVFGVLPRRVRSHPASGLVFGIAIWLGFELVIAPILGAQNKQGRWLGRVMLMADHALYGVMVSGRLAPEPEITRRRRA